MLYSYINIKTYIMKQLLKEFKEFAIKGNVIDLATAVIIGGAFGKIISSLVADIIMPVIGVLVGKESFSSWRLVLREGDLVNSISPIVMNLGLFLQNIIDFLIIAFVIFAMIKLINHLKNQFVKDEAKKENTISKQEELLTEIRDLLKKN